MSCDAIIGLNLCFIAFTAVHHDSFKTLCCTCLQGFAVVAFSKSRGLLGLMKLFLKSPGLQGLISLISLPVGHI